MRAQRDAGSATVWGLIAVLVIWAAAGVAVAQAIAIQTRHRAEAVADAAALAAASEGGIDPDAACAAARHIAERDGGVLVSCALAGPVATVEVALDPPNRFAWAGRVTARARGGPANTGFSNGTRTSRTPS